MLCPEDPLGKDQIDDIEKDDSGVEEYVGRYGEVWVGGITCPYRAEGSCDYSTKTKDCGHILVH